MRKSPPAALLALSWELMNRLSLRSFWTLSGSPSLLESQIIREIAERTRSTPAQAVFRVAQKLGIAPLSGSTNEGRMREGIEAEKIDIPDDEVASAKMTMSLLSNSNRRLC